MVDNFGIDIHKPIIFSMTIDKLFNSVFLFLLATICFYLLSPFQFWDLHPVLQDAEKISIGVQLVLALTGLLIVKMIIMRTPISVKVVDFGLIIYLLFWLLHAVIIIPINPDPLFVAENILLGALFICFRNIQLEKIKILFWVVILAGLSQVFYGIVMQAKSFAPGYGLSDIKGSFINQGPFAGFICCTIIVALGLVFYYLKEGKRYTVAKKWFVYFMLILSTAILLWTLIYAESRAAWVAVIFGLLFYGWRTFKLGDHLMAMHSPLVKYLFFISVITILIGSSYFLYNYKKDSADGRVLIWKTTLEMISDEPLLGHGVNTFQSHFMNYQADYFENQPDSQYRYLAGDNRYAFNELLRIASEQGMLGLFLLIVLIAIFIRKNKNLRLSNNQKYLHRISKTGLLVFIVFGLFSYPGEILPIKVVAVMFAAILASSSSSILEKSNVSSQDRPFFLIKKTSLVILFLGLSFVFIQLMELPSACKQWDSAFFETNSVRNESCISLCEKIYPVLQNNGDFLAMYGKALMNEERYSEAIEILQQAEILVPSTIIYIDKGKCFEGMELLAEAEKSWEKASYMVPAQFRPGYLTAKMYYANGQKEKAKKMASDLLQNKKVKVYSIPVYQILEELKEMADY